MFLKWRTRTKHVNFENVLSNETIKRWFESCIRMYLQYHKHHFWQSKTSLFIKWLHTKLRKKTGLNSDKKRVKTGCAKIRPAWRSRAAPLTCVRARARTLPCRARKRALTHTCARAQRPNARRPSSRTPSAWLLRTHTCLRAHPRALLRTVHSMPRHGAAASGFCRILGILVFSSNFGMLQLPELLKCILLEDFEFLMISNDNSNADDFSD